MLVPAGAPHLVVTSSYDGTLRALDLNRGWSWELSTAGVACGGVSAVDVDGVVPVEGRGGGGGDATVLLWAGTRSGAVMHVDARLPPNAPVLTWEAHEGKVTSVSALRGGGHTLSSTCSDGTAKLWDTRKLPRQGGAKPARAPAPISTLAHSRSVSSAYFSPHRGGHMVSTCSDDLLRLWAVRGPPASPPVVDPPAHAVGHDNRTGRWLTQFRTVFDPANDDTVVVGAMTSQEVQLYSAGTGAKLGALTSEYVTAVPTLNVIHPCGTTHAIASATASGRMYLWT
jgi:WD40 repeat protein